MKDNPAFLPSDVYLGGRLLDTFGRIERECTAAVMVQVLADNGNEWRTVTCEELSSGFVALTREPGFWRSWFANPFIRIDMHDLVNKGFAEWQGEKAIRFTDKGLNQLAKRVREFPNA